MYEYFACLYEHTPQACLVSTEARRKFRSLGTGITDDGELPCGHWGPNLGPMQKQHVLLTTQSSLQPLYSPPNQYYRMQRPNDKCGYDFIHKHVWNKHTHKRKTLTSNMETATQRRWWQRQKWEQLYECTRDYSCPQKPGSSGQNPTCTSRWEPPTHNTDLDFRPLACRTK